MNRRPVAWSLGIVAGCVLSVGGFALWSEARATAAIPAHGTWTLVKEWRSVGKKEDIAFPDSLNGWVVDAGGHILHSADGGRTWSVQAEKLGYLRSIELIDRRRGFAGTLDGRLYATTNGGAEWTDITKTLPRPAKGFCGIAHVGEAVHIVGRYQGATDYFFSPDAGKTWRYTDLSALASGLVDIEFLNDSVGLIAGTGKPKAPATLGAAVILKTTDGGRSWRPVHEMDAANSTAWKLFVVSSSVIYSAIQSRDGRYRVAKSTNGGDRWEILTVDTNQPVSRSPQGLGFIDENTGWLGGFFRGMYATTDGGRTWTLSPPAHATINRYAKVGGVLVTASDSGILRYERPAPGTVR